MKEVVTPIVSHPDILKFLQLEPVTGTHEERRAADQRNAARISREIARANRQEQSFLELD